MSFFNRIFRASDSASARQPDIRFGRYSDAYKTNNQYDAWDRALEKFEKEKYIEAYLDFFQYLKDPLEENVRFEEKNGILEFEFYQGSKKIIGQATPLLITAEAKIASSIGKDAIFMRRLLEHNFNLQYSRFAMDAEDHITIRFDSFTVDGSPYKLYYSLKEMATNADKQDDLLLDEFGMLKPIETAHLKPLETEEKEAKYQFIVSEIKRVCRQLDRLPLDAEKFPGGFAYLLLDLNYKLDYLVKPEGFMMESLERMNRLYFAQDNKSTYEKNQHLRGELEALANRPKAEFFKEMYRGTSTFGITSPVNHDRVTSFIDGEIINMDWYNQHDFEDIALAIPGYIIGYCLFNYAIPPPDKDLFHLYYQIIEPAYFKSLGYSIKYVDEISLVFDKKSIRKAVRMIAETHRERYPRLAPNTQGLDFSSRPNFAKSYLQMIRKLDMTRQM